jgi:pimeloyl-ACP methyl ester carboxylesterase
MTQPLQQGYGLEFVDKGSCSARHPVPLLFIHGAWHGAWCWERFLDFFAGRGYRAVAVSLRGHGASMPYGTRRGCSAADYLEDIKTAIDHVGSKPILIGHSMGGLLIQMHLASNEAPAGVLVASAPPQGGRRFAMALARRHPWLYVRSLFTGDSVHGYNKPAITRKWFYSAGTPESDVVRYAAMLCTESQRAGVDLARTNLVAVDRVKTPLLVLGAKLDGCITEAEVQATAQAFGTEPEIFDGMGHNMMLEPGWETVAERIDSWLTDRGL